MYFITFYREQNSLFVLPPYKPPNCKSVSADSGYKEHLLSIFRLQQIQGIKGSFEKTSMEKTTYNDNKSDKYDKRTNLACKKKKDSESLPTFWLFPPDSSDCASTLSKNQQNQPDKETGCSAGKRLFLLVKLLKCRY